MTDHVAVREFFNTHEELSAEDELDYQSRLTQEEIDSIAPFSSIFAPCPHSEKRKALFPRDKCLYPSGGLEEEIKAIKGIFSDWFSSDMPYSSVMEAKFCMYVREILRDVDEGEE